MTKILYLLESRLKNFRVTRDSGHFRWILSNQDRIIKSKAKLMIRFWMHNHRHSQKLQTLFHSKLDCPNKFKIKESCNQRSNKMEFHRIERLIKMILSSKMCWFKMKVMKIQNLLNKSTTFNNKMIMINQHYTPTRYFF